MPNQPTNGIPALPRFSSPDGSPSGAADWQQLYRWLIQVRGVLNKPSLILTAAQLALTPAVTYTPGTLVYISDRGLFYVQSGMAWIYVSGELVITQNQIAALGLGQNDAGVLVNVTDYGHTLRWAGLNFTWGPGDPGSGFLQLFEVDPTGAGWHLYDGSNVTYLKADGTLGAVILPNLAADASFLAAGSPNGGINPAVGPTATGGGGTIAAAATGITAGPTSNDTGPGTIVQSGTGATVAAEPHVHATVSITDPKHIHGFTPVQPTISADGKPQNIVRRPFFRQ